MTLDAGKTCCTNQTQCWRASRIGLYLQITAFRGEAQIGDIHLVPIPARTHQEILRLHVTVDDILRVNIFQPMKKLVGKHQYRLKRELATTKIEKILQTRSQKVEYHNIVFAFGQRLVNAWNTNTTRKRSIDISLKLEEGGIDRDVFELNSNLFASTDVGS